MIGRSASATKYTVLAALGNVGDLYMTVTSGWIHDRWSTETMLVIESVFCTGVHRCGSDVSQTY